MSVSVLAKAKLNDKFAKIQKKISDDSKARQKLEGKKALSTVTEYFEENKDVSYFVATISGISANSKALNEAINFIKTKQPEKSVYLFAGEKGKVAHGCYIGKPALDKGVSAQDLGSVATKFVEAAAAVKALLSRDLVKMTKRSPTPFPKLLLSSSLSFPFK